MYQPNLGLPDFAQPTEYTTLDLHTAGEPLRIITSGVPDIPGVTMLERRRWLREHADQIRRALIWEPRGHADMYGAIITPPATTEADLGVLFLHNEGYSTMCGHGIIALVTALLETGALEPQGQTTLVAIDTPAGLVRATAHHAADGRVAQVTFLNVPSFVLADDVPVNVPRYGTLRLAVAYGGAFYAILPAAAVGLTVEPTQRAALVAAGTLIKAATRAALPIVHPESDDLGFLYGTIFTDAPAHAPHHSRNVCIFANGETDRSPTGTGVSARVALHVARNELALGQTIMIESILGAQSTFTGRAVLRTAVGEYAAIVPEVGGTAFMTGRSAFVIDPRDTLGAGFLL